MENEPRKKPGKYNSDPAWANNLKQYAISCPKWPP